jgi:hypothetical protein
MPSQEYMPQVMHSGLGFASGLTKIQMFGENSSKSHGNMVCGVYKRGAMYRQGKAFAAAVLPVTSRKMGGAAERCKNNFHCDDLRATQTEILLAPDASQRSDLIRVRDNSHKWRKTSQPAAFRHGRSCMAVRRILSAHRFTSEKQTIERTNTSPVRPMFGHLAPFRSEHHQRDQNRSAKQHICNHLIAVPSTFIDALARNLVLRQGVPTSPLNGASPC